MVLTVQDKGTHVNIYILIAEACKLLSSPNEPVIDILLWAVIKDNGIMRFRLS